MRTGKRTVAGLIAELGFGPIDTGSLRAGGLLQRPGSAIYGQGLRIARANDVPGG